MNQENKKLPKYITAVVAIAENRAIGKDNELLWRMPADLKHFKSVTTGGTVIMGRRTFDSINRPLPNRHNIVVTHQKYLDIEGVTIAHSIDEALATVANENEVFIVGGAGIYNAAMNHTNRIYLTTVHHNFDADTFFPELKLSEWKIISEEPHPADEKNPYPYTFTLMERK